MLGHILLYGMNSSRKKKTKNKKNKNKERKKGE